MAPKRKLTWDDLSEAEQIRVDALFRLIRKIKARLDQEDRACATT